MSEAPERIWARTTSIACGSWDDYRMVESRLWSPYDSEGSVEYIRADRIEELEAKLAKAVEALKCVDQLIMENTTDYDLLMWGEPTVSHIRTTLAEIKGTNQ